MTLIVTVVVQVDPVKHPDVSTRVRDQVADALRWTDGVEHVSVVSVEPES